MNRMGTGMEGNQATSNRSKGLGAARGGARAGKPRWVSILAMTGGSTMAAMIRKEPPQWGHCSISISKELAAVNLKRADLHGDDHANTHHNLITLL